MNEKTDALQTLNNKYAKEICIRDSLINKRKDLDLKIKKSEEIIKQIKDDIENLEIKNTVTVIKQKGYTLAYVQEAIQAGILDEFLDNENNKAENMEDDNKC